MSYSGHTPGPWEWIEDKFNGGYSGVVGKDNAEVLFPNHRNDGDDGDAWFEDFPSEADRNLIAAAPDMYEALRSIENDDGSIPNTIWEMAQKALAKAEGK